MSLSLLKSSIYSYSREEYWLGIRNDDLLTNKYSYIHDPSYVSTENVVYVQPASSYIDEEVRVDLPKIVEENQEFVLVEPWKKLTRLNRESGTTLFRDSEDEGRWFTDHELIKRCWSRVGRMAMSQEDKQEFVSEMIVRYYELKQRIQQRADEFTDGEVPIHPMGWYLTIIKNKMIDEHRKKEATKAKDDKKYGKIIHTSLGEDEEMGITEFNIVRESEIELWFAGLSNHYKGVVYDFIKMVEQEDELDKNFQRRVERVPKVSRDYSESVTRSSNQKVRGDGLRDDNELYNFPVKTTRVRKW